MKKRFLHFYDKIIIAFIFGILALFGCTRRTFPEKKADKSEQSSDSLRNEKPDFNREIIAMYGVRPTRNIK